MHKLQVVLRFVAGVLAIASVVNAQAQAPTSGGSTPAQPAQVLFENVRIFDGTGAALSGPANVLVRGNRIERISTGPVPANDTAGATIIAGGGRTLIPGLIDAHWHATLARPTPAQVISADIGYSMIDAGLEATDTLMRGFTTVRDLGGPSFGLKRAIDENLIPGPRIFPSGAFITVTGGHGDFRQLFEVPRVDGMPLTRIEQLGGAVIADSPDEVTRRAREQLMLGASQIKLTAGGGVSSPHSPIDVISFTSAELEAAVRVASDRGTYVETHAFTPAAIQRAVRAGVKSIEHGNLMDEETAKLMAEKGAWLSIQPMPEGFENIFPPGSEQRAKALEVLAGTDRAYQLAKKYHLKTAFGTDILFSPELAKRQGSFLVELTKWYTPAEALHMATGENAELLALSGERSPYRGKLGVVQEGALADLLLVDGDPVKDIKLIEDPAKNFLIIMKDGRIYKNTVPK
ncbi:amidohydrolase family protein [Dyella solisilvae]|uniref:Amidohydrolase family protein n=1 Tax=Dyella solisilvae TaxID=1920168 RepID=A0A370K4F7_9GAMM|nr:amidohydrolase family protein [Dyella solisilvae]RDI97514.1 amidohydrolase family protein [Dyella solisilvae]